MQCKKQNKLRKICKNGKKRFIEKSKPRNCIRLDLLYVTRIFII